MASPHTQHPYTVEYAAKPRRRYVPLSLMVGASAILLVLASIGAGVVWSKALHCFTVGC